MATEKFIYHTESGAKIALKRFKHLPFRLMRDLKDIEGQEAMFAMLEAATTKKDFETLLDVSIEEAGTIIQAWQKDSDVTPGESAAS